MRPVFIVIGLMLVCSAMAISALGRYDGILGATSPAEILSPTAPSEGVVRVRVVGTADDAAAEFAHYRVWLVLPVAMEQEMDEQRFVPVEFEDDRSRTAFLAYGGDAPQDGSLLVVTATLTTHWPIVPTDQVGFAGPPDPIIFLGSVEYHAPLFFK
ncbi:MAG TPA: hypothetical protein VI818_05650 [Candidatus Thermoplasmatota archaeon]|nr:hypothetical protein [Candidatus Thermoplasmatota archaeon]